jgi:hypothetical protein
LKIEDVSFRFGRIVIYLFVEVIVQKEGGMEN